MPSPPLLDAPPDSRYNLQKVVKKRMNEILLRTSLATLAALVGGGIGVAAGAATGRLDALVPAAAGALLAVTAVSLLPEAAHLLPAPELVLALLSGYALFYLIGRYVFPLCPACASSRMDARAVGRLEGTAVLLAVALTLHSVMDGVAVAAGQHMQHASDLPLFLAVSFHKLPEGLALAALLLRAGYAPRAALLWTTGVELTTLAGGVLGAWFLRGMPLFWLGALLAHVAGGFLYLVLHALLDGAPARPRASQVGYGTLGFGAVALLLWGLQRFAGN